MKATKIETLYYQIGIQPCPSGFDEYQRHANGPSAADGMSSASDILCEVDGDSYELGADDLPPGVEDISGRIHNSPSAVYAVVFEDGECHYIGIDANETYCDADTGEAIMLVRDYQDAGRLEEKGYAMPVTGSEVQS